MLKVTGRSGSGRRVREEARCWEGDLSRGGEVVQQEEEVEGSSSEDEGLGSSPPLSPEKPLSDLGKLSYR